MPKNGMLRILTTLQAMHPRNCKNMDKLQKMIMANAWSVLMSDVNDDNAFTALRKLLSICNLPPAIADSLDSMRQLVCYTHVQVR